MPAGSASSNGTRLAVTAAMRNDEPIAWSATKRALYPLASDAVEESEVLGRVGAQDGVDVHACLEPLVGGGGCRAQPDRGIGERTCPRTGFLNSAATHTATVAPRSAGITNLQPSLWTVWPMVGDGGFVLFFTGGVGRGRASGSTGS
jgi:hypothetical protein